jgi:hypothetical protein
MSDKQPYQHRSEIAGTRDGDADAETEHRDAARTTGEARNELNPEERKRQDGYGPRTHPATQIDPDPRFEDESA